MYNDLQKIIITVDCGVQVDLADLKKFCKKFWVIPIPAV